MHQEIRRQFVGSNMTESKMCTVSVTSMANGSPPTMGTYSMNIPVPYHFQKNTRYRLTYIGLYCFHDTLKTFQC